MTRAVWTCPICHSSPCTCTPEGSRQIAGGPILGCRCGNTMTSQDMRRHPGAQARAGRIAPIVCPGCAARARRRPDQLVQRVARDLGAGAGAALTVVALGLTHDVVTVLAAR